MKQFLVPLASFLALSPAFASLPETQISPDDFDLDVIAEWVDGNTFTDVEFHPNRDDPTWIISTTSTRPGHVFRFGSRGESPGTRHFRIGFHWPVPVGTILLGADEVVRLSMLKPDARYPGELDNEEHWQEIEKVHGIDLQWLVLPEVEQTRALRFSYETDEHAPARSASISGLYIFPERVANVAPQAVAVTSSRQEAASRLTDGRRYSWWNPWSNVAGDRAGEHKVSAERPEWLLLAWSEEVPLSGLVTLWTGFRTGEVQRYVGPEDLHPREADEEHWATIEERQFHHYYPSGFSPNWILFGNEIPTRAVRIRITEPISEERVHSHMRGKSHEGTRIWLGELMALVKLGDRPLSEVLPAAGEATLTPPIPVRFSLDQPGFVTLVIEDEEGKRLRNLVSETWFEAGEHTVHWDGTDESITRPMSVRLGDGRVSLGVHGLNETDGRIVKPGTYLVRGIVRDPIDLRYQWTVGHAGRPPWATPDGTGRWLADHSAPSDALFIPTGADGEPQMMLSARVAEAGEGLIWTDLDGRRQRGVRWLGGHWTGAFFLARDEGPKSLEDVQAYAASTWSVSGKDELGELRVTELLNDGGSRPVLNHPFEHEGQGHDLLRGLAVRDGMAFLSMKDLDQLVMVDAREGRVIGKVPLEAPAGLAFDNAGGLLALSEGKLLRFDLTGFQPGISTALPKPKVVVSKGLEAPVNLALDPSGKIYISDRGQAHNVKVFEASGKLVREIGTPGGPQVGPYDETRMQHPAGLSVDERGQLWVAEADVTPKRISVWSPDGKLVRAFYGPSQYGGGGTVDPKDPTRVYYARQWANSAMEFHVDPETGESKLAHVIYRRLGDDELALPNFRGTDRGTTGPQWPIYYGGNHYMTNAFNSNPTNGANVVSIWQMRDGIAQPVAAAGAARRWPILKEAPFAELWPEGSDPDNTRGNANADVFFVWSDRNNDGQVQPDEVTFRKLSKPTGTVFVGEDLGLMTSHTYRIGVEEISEEGVPIYDLAGAKQIVADPVVSRTSGGGEAFPAGDWVVLTGGPMQGFNAEGELVWTYPSNWPGLHAGQRAPARQQHPGQMVATTRILGQPFRPKGTDVELWAINGDKGQIFLMTTDGFFVATLGAQADGPRWNMNRQEHGMLLNEVNFIGEHFWPTLIQPEDGPPLLVAGKQHSSVVTVDGLDTIRRLPEGTVTVTELLVAEAGEYRRALDLLRQQREGRGTLTVRQLEAPIPVDGSPDAWEDAHWVPIDGEHVEAAMAADQKTLYLAFRTTYPDLIKNSGDSLPMLFKTGGGLDLMIGANPDADPDRSEPVPGDQRLLIAEVDDELRAVLYRPEVPGADPAEAVGFSSPWRTVSIDQVNEVSEELELAQGVWQRGRARYFLYEVAIPWELLDVQPSSGLRLAGDVGVLRGQGGETVQRLYWQNKSTNIVEDIPAEAMLTPHLWGILQFEDE